MEKIIHKENILWVDYAKFISIFLVIATHTIETLDLLNIIIILVLSCINLIINYFIIKFVEKRVSLILGKGFKNASN